MLIFKFIFSPLIVVSLLPTVIRVCVEMSCSIEDIKNLLAGQTEALTQVRNHERAEDIQKISEMMQISIQKQITDAIDPIVKRQDNFEVILLLLQKSLLPSNNLWQPLSPPPLKTSLLTLLMKTTP